MLAYADLNLHARGDPATARDPPRHASGETGEREAGVAGETGSRGGRRRMIEDMAVLHMTEAELARDLHAALEKVRQGAEIVVEEGYRTVAIIKPVQGPGRPLDECIAL